MDLCQGVVSARVEQQFMTPGEWQRIKDLFAEAIEKPADAREDFLKDACDGRSDIYDEVVSLIAASADPENLIENNSYDLASKIVAQETPITEQHFGRYKIIREIGSGGMGTVFLAERNDGEFVMQVALKIVRQSVADREIIERFRRERQILADLQHPNVAALHDGGVSEKGEPFLAMEFIDGEPLIEYANTHNLSVDDRIRLLIKVCSAVAFAHRNLIVHRDIKPSNILVGADGEPKLLDFGLAKSFDSKDSVIQTTLRAFTPAYASPEQITGGNITTASDIYSIGVILYELLTGSKPLQFEDKSFEEIVQTAIATSPRPPSEALNTENRKLRGDLDNIALMALRKEPGRRYRSIEDLADDLQNHLDDRPVAARASTFAYRTSKFVARNKIAVAASALVLVSLLAGIGVSLWQAEIAKRQSARSETVNQFLQKMLLTAIPETGANGKRGRELTIIDVLDEVERSLDNDLSTEPEVRAELRQIIGDAYLSQGRYDDAERNLEHAFSDQTTIFGSNSRETLKTEMSLASLYFARANYDKALDMFDRRYTSFKNEFQNKRIEPEFFLPKQVEFATICRAVGQSERAESLLHEAIVDATTFGNDHSTSAAKTILTLLLLDQGRFAEARSYQSDLVTKLRTSLPTGDPALAAALTLLGSIQMENGSLKDAESSLKEGETVYRHNYGPEYLPLYDNLRLQAQTAYLARDYATAQRLIDSVLTAYQKNAGPKYISFATALTIKGLVANKTGNSADAENILNEALKLRLENLPPDHFMTALTKGALGEVLLDQKKYAEAGPLVRESLEGLIKSQKSENNRLAAARQRLARLDASQ
ncbi:MAG: serine/threonine-protein kinase [Pyrinomonadaceae bacterium]